MSALLNDDDEDVPLYVRDPSKRLECRFYENQFPEVESVVMVNVRTIAEMGAYVTLLEYNSIEGEERSPSTLIFFRHDSAERAVAKTHPVH